MAIVYLKPGDTLNIIWNSPQITPLGTTDIESCFSYSYEEIIQGLKNSSIIEAKKSEEECSKFSRHVGLAFHAFKKGVWSSGSPINRKAILINLITHFQKIKSVDYIYISKKAKASLDKLANLKELDKMENKEAIVEIANLLKSP